MSKSYSEWSTEDLIKEIKQLKKRKKFGLVWEDKPEDVAEMCKTKLPILKAVDEKEIKDKDSEVTNVIIEGDNYHSLSVLAYTHPKEIDVIYIDPPYNTGNHSWKYNNKFVDKEDTYRHSKWLSFMAKRLRLSKKLLKKEGVLIVTIDDYELAPLTLLLDQIYGEQNRLGTVAIVHNPRGRSDDKHFASCHEYALFYAKDAQAAKTHKLLLTEEQEEDFPEDDGVSRYRLLSLKRTGSNSTPKERPNLYYPIYYDIETNTGHLKPNKKSYIEIFPIDKEGNKRVWRWGKDTMEERMATEVVFKNNGGKVTIFGKDRIKEGRKPKTVWVDPKYDASSHGTILLDAILEKRKAFDYPKSINAVLDCLYVADGTNKNSTVLDFFAGSGTTGHAVLELNKKDGGNRKFILCTNNENNNGSGEGIAESICYPRIKRVMEGYTRNGKQLEGLGGNLKYFRTDFVDQVVTDNDKREFVTHSTDMLCLAEDTFESVIYKKAQYAIFSNNKKATGIVYDEDFLKEFKKEITKLKLPTAVYVFSYDNNYDEEDFNDLDALVKVKPIPASILNVYARIVRESEKKINI